MPDRDQKTEKATPQRLKKAREEGRFAASREFVSGLQFAAFAVLLTATGSIWSRSLLEGMRILLRAAFSADGVSRDTGRVVLGVTTSWLMAAGCVGLALQGAMILGQLATTGLGLAPTKLVPDFSRLNPANRLKGMAGRNLKSACESILFLAILGYAGYKVFARYSPEFLFLPFQSLLPSVLFLSDVFSRLLLFASAIVLIWGGIDLVRQKKKYATELKMTKQEIKDEWKQNEGNPEFKLRIRRLRNELLRRHMLAEVPKATAVIVNPTHYAVALRYEHLVMAAPKIIAKGQNLIAQRIREIARDRQIPIIENPPLAQALYRNCEVGQEIPASLYKAVAEVLAYVLRIMNKRM
jgi:flagellar biosynthetic protein FlhB